MGDFFNTVRRCGCAGALGSDAGIMGTIFWLVLCGRWEERIPVSLLESTLSVAMNASCLKSAFSHASVSMQRCRAEDARYYDSPQRRKIILCECGLVDGCINFSLLVA